ncbi:MAG: hypothetical protein FWG35_03315, partial [Spirochaetaceae bacterium]|nr:hypothetical protein [Spirochaetaceae bacterium]
MVIATQAPGALLNRFFLRNWQLNQFKIMLALKRLAFGVGNPPAQILIAVRRRRNTYPGFNLMGESEIGIYIRRGYLSGLNSANNRGRTYGAVSSGKNAGHFGDSAGRVGFYHIILQKDAAGLEILRFNRLPYCHNDNIAPHAFFREFGVPGSRAPAPVFAYYLRLEDNRRHIAAAVAFQTNRRAQLNNL